MEDLTKHQLILLALLVSFVTSIATGIVITSVLSESPKTITQTFTNVVEKTIEKVVPGEIKAEVIASTGVAGVVETKVIKEEDLIVAAIEKNAKSIVRVWGTYTRDPATFISYGVIVAKDGMIVTDKAGVVEGGKYFAFFPDGKNYVLELVARNDIDKVAYFRISSEETTVATSSPKTPKAAPVQFPVATSADPNQLKLGQTLIAITGIEKNSIIRGTLTGVVGNDNEPSLVTTDITLAAPGFPMINLAGELVGIHTYRGESGQIVPLRNLEQHLKEFASTTRI